MPLLEVGLNLVAMPSSTSGSFMTPSAIGLGSEWRGPESLCSKSERPKSPSESITELSAKVDADGVEAESETGTRVNTLTAFALDFFFLA